MTTEQINRVARDWSKIAHEPIDVQDIAGTIYGFCTELAALRLFHHYNMIGHNPKTKAFYSMNRRTWCFRIEPQTGE